MDAIKTIMTRLSVRKFDEREISDELLQTILAAGMSGPSCANTRDWSFIVVRDREMLNKMADANGKPAQPLRQANIGILVCGDLNRSFKPAKDYWIIDCSIAAQNMSIAAHALGLGSVWLGTYPQMDRVKKQSDLFQLPDLIVPHSILALGYPAEPNNSVEKKSYETDRIHYEKYNMVV